MEKIKAVIESLIFASDTPLAVEKIRAIFPDVEKADIKEMIDQLAAEYQERQGGICLQEVAGGFQFRTNPELSSWIKKLKTTKPQSLSPQAMETLAIIAYRQPIVKSEIEDIRGVDVGGQLKGLMEKKLIRIVGRKDVPGKPIIYGTTKKFLEVFNLKDIMDLPNIRELKELHKPQEPIQQELLDEEMLDEETQPLQEPDGTPEQILEPVQEQAQATQQESEKEEVLEPEKIEELDPEIVEETKEKEPVPEQEIAEEKPADHSES